MGWERSHLGGPEPAPESHPPHVHVFTGFDLPCSDRPLTHLTSGATVDVSYNAWAAHPGWFHVYVTRDGFDRTRTLTWNDMEDQPFLTADHPPLNGTPGTLEATCSWSGRLPANKSGRHIVYWCGSARTARRPSPAAPTSSSTEATAK